MKLISWNVNGIRAAIKKGFLDYFNEQDADIFCLQETKLSEGQLNLELPGYHQYWNYAEKKGYSGTAIFTKEKPLSVAYGIGIEEHDKEGRVITLEFEKFYMITVYTPNSKDELLRLDYRMVWEDEFRKYLKKLEEFKPVVVCGDLNVAHKEIDLKNPKTNRRNPGFTDEEREKFSKLLDSGFVDTFRYFYPNLEHAYSWWSYRANARKNNTGWRIDYFVVSSGLEKNLKDAEIHAQTEGSDHCPVVLFLDFEGENRKKVKTKIEDKKEVLKEMGEVKFLCYPRCSTCQKAKKWLETNNIKFDERDIVKLNPNESELKEFYQNSGKELKRFFNTSGILYREMGLKDKLPNMSEDEQIKLLATDGKLVKRPLVVSKNGVLIGFKEEEWKEFFKK